MKRFRFDFTQSRKATCGGRQAAQKYMSFLRLCAYLASWREINEFLIFDF